jgi:thiamine-phosphate pyrophosphorylase
MSFLAYLITDSAYGCATPKAFVRRLNGLLQAKHADCALYRDKHNEEYAGFAVAFVGLCRKRGVKAILHRDVALAKRLGADGVHLTSQQFDAITEAKRAGLMTVVSTHTIGEIVRAASMGADAVTYSPIFETPGKGAPKGLDDLNETAGKIEIPVIALGGIVTAEQIDAVKAAGAAGFASIRYFLEESICSK